MTRVVSGFDFKIRLFNPDPILIKPIKSNQTNTLDFYFYKRPLILINSYKSKFLFNSIVKTF
ncbi:hypothetical protein EXS82_07730 [Helicobacter pylori]|nr:hypothetical protein [Helicobacter pylori]